MPPAHLVPHTVQVVCGANAPAHGGTLLHDGAMKNLHACAARAAPFLAVEIHS
jgi:hypothetical protein